MLNSVGLSNIGILALIEKSSWQVILAPFMISVMAVGKTREEREDEIQKITMHLAKLIPMLHAPIAIQLNVSCPNTKHRIAQDAFVEEVLVFLSLLATLEVSSRKYSFFSRFSRRSKYRYS